VNNLTIRDERGDGNRYTAHLDETSIGSLSALLVGKTVLLPHIEVDAARHDLGIGSLLVRRALDDARAEGHTVLALSPFIKRWADLHPGYHDVVRKPLAGELTAVSSLIDAERVVRLLRGSTHTAL
jgi:predicted GNAT family acetyltransferase